MEFENGRIVKTGTGTTVSSTSEALSVCGIGVELTNALFE
jgi:hypothetical protein